MLLFPAFTEGGSSREKFLESVARALLKKMPAKMVVEELERVGVASKEARCLTNSQRRLYALSGRQKQNR